MTARIPVSSTVWCVSGNLPVIDVTLRETSLGSATETQISLRDGFIFIPESLPTTWTQLLIRC